MPDRSRASASSNNGVNKCSNAHGSARSGAATEPLVGFRRAVSIQIASSIHSGIRAEELRRTLANRASTSAIDSPSRASLLQNSDQSPLAHALHQAARRRAAKSASLF